MWVLPSWDWGAKEGAASFTTSLSVFPLVSRNHSFLSSFHLLLGRGWERLCVISSCPCDNPPGPSSFFPGALSPSPFLFPFALPTPQQWSLPMLSGAGGGVGWGGGGGARNVGGGQVCIAASPGTRSSRRCRQPRGRDPAPTRDSLTPGTQPR